MINKLYPYQDNAVNEIEEKFNDYLRKTPIVGFKDNPAIIPFICSLKSITGSGKTAMLALTAYRLLNRYKNSLVL
jgi:CRISPR/Cas system-associated endonuclease/helicase Cas3